MPMLPAGNCDVGNNKKLDLLDMMWKPEFTILCCMLTAVPILAGYRKGGSNVIFTFLRSGRHVVGQGNVNILQHFSLLLDCQCGASTNPCEPFVNTVDKLLKLQNSDDNL